jgi:solute carrier family 9B (sodium/hydrogen exchanger), member 1/2
MLVMGGGRYNWRERIFYAVAWTPKATVQASLSAVPLALIERVMQGRPDLPQWQQWGLEILTTGVFAILLCGSFGTLCVYALAPVLLEQEVRRRV